MASLMRVARNSFRIIKQNNGIFGSLYKLFRMDDLKWGRHVGTDRYGNKYFENYYYFYPRTRWVEYNEKFFLDYDGSQIPPEWHMWMHYTTDSPPNEKCPVAYKWMVPHQENKSGTNQIYYPYSTTRTKIQSWMPTHLRGSDYDEVTEGSIGVKQNTSAAGGSTPLSGL